MPQKKFRTLDALEGRYKLSPAEFQYMKIIWAHPEGISSQKIYEQLDGTQGTKSATLHKISEKGYVRNVQQGLHHIYYANVTQLEYEKAMIQQQVKDFFGHDSLESLIAAFCGKTKLNKSQMKKLSSFLEELEHEGDAE